MGSQEFELIRANAWLERTAARQDAYAKGLRKGKLQNKEAYLQFDFKENVTKPTFQHTFCTGPAHSRDKQRKNHASSCEAGLAQGSARANHILIG